jgi:fluoride exporter
MGTLAAVAVGGALGASARYGLDRFIEEHSESLFPLATFAINISGCLLSALIITVAVERLSAPTWVGVGATVGFVGAYTTFSTFAVEAYELLFDMRHVAVAIAYVVSSSTVGIGAVALGTWLGRR